MGMTVEDFAKWTVQTKKPFLPLEGDLKKLCVNPANYFA